MWYPGVWNTPQTVCVPEQVNLEIAPYNYRTRTLFSCCSDDNLTYLRFEGKAHSFLEFPGAFTKSQKATTSFLYLPVCLFVPLHEITLGSTGRIFMKFDIRVIFENLSRNSSLIKIRQE